MTLFHVVKEDCLDECYYKSIRDNARSAIERINLFTKSVEFEEADKIILDIKLGLLDANFKKFIQANDSLLCDPENDETEGMEKVYTTIKTELMTKKENLSEPPSVQLYKRIVQGLYPEAVKMTEIITSSCQGDLITSVVTRLAQERNSNLLSYVYQIWNSGQKTIVEQYLPETLKAIFNGLVTLVQKKYGLALKLGVKVDHDGDRGVWGDSKDKTSSRVIWQLTPFWDLKDNQVFFRIKNLEHDMYLKLAVDFDRTFGVREAFGSNNSATDRHAWILMPVVIDADIFFFIFNREYNQKLMLQASFDSMGDRKLWGDDVKSFSDPSHFAWSIQKIDAIENSVTEKLYQHIVKKEYSDAFKVTKSIITYYVHESTLDVVMRLAKEGNRNLLSYVYKLWIGGSKNYVEQRMHRAFTSIFNGWVTLVQKKFGLALKLDVNVVSNGDRKVWGDSQDKTSRRVSWKFVPFWESEQVVFRIQNLEHNMYLKLADCPDDTGDRAAFGCADNDGDSNAWILEPLVIDGDLYFHIVNRKYNQRLKLQASTDDIGDRRLWGDGGHFHSEPSNFAWSITPAANTQ